MSGTNESNRVLNTKILSLQNQVAFLSLTIATLKAQMKDIEDRLCQSIEVCPKKERSSSDDSNGYETDELAQTNEVKEGLIHGMTKQQYIMVSMGSIDDSDTESGYDSDEIRLEEL